MKFLNTEIIKTLCSSIEFSSFENSLKNLLSNIFLNKRSIK